MSKQCACGCGGVLPVPKLKRDLLVTHLKAHRSRRDPVVCFWEKVVPEPNSGCWLWVGAISNGYANFAVRRKRNYGHRFSYELLRGPIPEGLELDHLCRNRQCVNPAHLEPVTHLENTLRGISKWNEARRRGTCLGGHPRSPENIYVWRRRSFCKPCLSIRAKARWQRRLARKVAHA